MDFSSLHTMLASVLGDLGQILGSTGLPGFTDRTHPSSNIAPGASILTSVIFTSLDFLKYLMGTVAVFALIISGLKLVTATTKIDEVSQKEKENIKFIIYGLILIIIADQLVKKVFFGDYGECFASSSNAQACASAGGGIIENLANFVLAIMASLALFTIVVSAFRMVTSLGEEEVITKEKKRIAMAVVGLVVAGVAEFLVKGVVFPKHGSEGVDIVAAQKLVFNLTEFVASFIGTAAFLMLFYAGYMYAASFGNEELTGKAKKIIISALIGILIAFGAFGLVKTMERLAPQSQVALPAALPGVEP